MPTDLTQRIAEAQALFERGTQGNWRSTHGMDHRAMVLTESDKTFRVRVDGHADADWIAAAHNLWLELMAERVELSAQLGKIANLVDHPDRKRERGERPQTYAEIIAAITATVEDNDYLTEAACDKSDEIESLRAQLAAAQQEKVELEVIAKGLRELDWCAGYALTPNQHLDLDKLRQRAIALAEIERLRKLHPEE